MKSGGGVSKHDNNENLSRSPSSSGSTEEDTTFSRSLQVRSLDGHVGMGSGNRSRHMMLLQIQILSGSLGLVSLRFLSTVLTLELQGLLLLAVLSFGMLITICLDYIQIEIQEVRRRGLVTYLPQSISRLLTETSLHDWMTDPTFVLETRHLLLYFIGLSPDQLDDTINQLPARRRQQLLRPGLIWMLPGSIQNFMLPTERRRVEDLSTVEAVQYPSDNAGEILEHAHNNQPTYIDAISNLLTMVASPFVVGLGTEVEVTSGSLNDTQAMRSAPTFDLNPESRLENPIPQNRSIQSLSSDDLSMDLGFTIEDEFGGGLSNTQAQIIGRSIGFSGNDVVEVEDINIERADRQDGDSDDNNENIGDLADSNDDYAIEGRVITEAISAIAWNVTSSASSTIRASLDSITPELTVNGIASLAGRVITEAISATAWNITSSARSTIRDVLGYSLDSITPVLTVTGIGSMIGIGAVYIQPMLQRGIGRPSFSPGGERNSPFVTGLTASALGAGGFLMWRLSNRIRFKTSKED